MPCCVPACANPLQEWTTEFPGDLELQARWKTAIEAGTGQCLPEVRPQLVCNVHFAAAQQQDVNPGDVYREPSLFIRDKIQLHVASCRLCFRFDTIESMFDTTDSLVRGQSLQWMVNKYFRLSQFSKDCGKGQYFCEACTVQIDLVHTFCQQISDAAKQYKKLLRKMSKHQVIFKSAGSGHIQSEPTDTTINYSATEYKSSIHAQDEYSDYEAPEHVIVKEEPQLVDSELTQNVKIDEGQETSESGDLPPKPRKSSIFKCYICNITLDSKKSRVQHLMIDHAAQESYRCEECRLTFGKIMSYNIHLSKHDSERRLKCDFCSLRFNWRKAKLYHEAAVHGNGKLHQNRYEQKKHTCATCGKVYCNKTEMERHERMQHRGEAFVNCTICNKPFATVRSLEAHLVIHQNESPLHQPAVDDEMVVSEEVIVKEKPQLAEPDTIYETSAGTSLSAKFKCNICNFNQESKKSLVQHLMIDHIPKESYSCAKCNQSFAKIMSFNIHLSKHDRERRFKCGYCSVRFNCKKGRKYHEAAQHGTDHKLPERKKIQNKYKCTTCDKVYCNKLEMERHVQVEHRGEAFINCTICNEAFTTLRHLENHLVVHRTDDAPLATRNGGRTRRTPTCNVCQATFKKSNDILTHFKDVHPEANLVAYPCTECDEVYFMLQSLRVHRNVCRQRKEQRALEKDCKTRKE